MAFLARPGEGLESNVQLRELTKASMLGTSAFLRRRMRGAALRTLLVNLAVLIVLLAGFELAARAFIWWTRGSQTAGLQERTVHLSYKPFVMYGVDWDERLAPTARPRRPGVCRVLLVGGSTAQGFPLDILERALTMRFEGKPFEVLNGAHGGYEARQELVLASIWGPALSPHALISLDGANDLQHRLRVKRPGRFYLDSTYELYLTEPWIAPLAWLLSRSQLFNGTVRLMQRGQLAGPEAYADAIPVYVEAQRSLNALAKGMGAARLMVLQPHIAFKSPRSGEEAAFRLYEYREGVMRTLYNHTADQLAALAARDGVGFLDARSTFADDAGHVFIDDVHLTAHGYRRLADSIASSVAALRPTLDASCGIEALPSR